MLTTGQSTVKIKFRMEDDIQYEFSIIEFLNIANQLLIIKQKITENYYNHKSSLKSLKNKSDVIQYNITNN
jgi:hypothetical protein